MHVEFRWSLPETGDIGGACPGWHAHSSFITASAPSGAAFQSIASRPSPPCVVIERSAAYLHVPVHRVRAKAVSLGEASTFNSTSHAPALLDCASLREHDP